MNEEIDKMKKMSNWEFFWEGFCLKGGLLPLALLALLALAALYDLVVYYVF